MKKFLIFDLDGTLIDTAEGITKAVNNVLAHFEYPYHYTKEEIIKFLGHGARYLYAHATKKDEISEEEFNYFTIEYVKFLYTKKDINYLFFQINQMEL